jgi:pilus assembly protein Flp/PilA
MQALAHLVLNLCRDRKAATAVEYGFILALIVVAVMAAIIQVAGTTTSMWNEVSSKVLTPD